MADRSDLQEWLVQALTALGGSASIVPICRWVWENHENDLRHSGDLFYKWQYDIRWEANKLRKHGVIKSVSESPKGVWELRGGRGG